MMIPSIVRLEDDARSVPNNSSLGWLRLKKTF